MKLLDINRLKIKLCRLQAEMFVLIVGVRSGCLSLLSGIGAESWRAARSFRLDCCSLAPDCEAEAWAPDAQASLKRHQLHRIGSLPSTLFRPPCHTFEICHNILNNSRLIRTARQKRPEKQGHLSNW